MSDLDALVDQLTGTIAELVVKRVEDNEKIAALEKEIAIAYDVRDRAREASNRDLEKSREIAYMQHRVAAWVKDRIGAQALAPAERAMRLYEEAVELAQAEGITEDMLTRQVAHVYGRKPGEPMQEAGGVAICLFGWCESRGVSFVDVARAELERIEAKPAEEIRGSLARKADADLFVSAVGVERG